MSFSQGVSGLNAANSNLDVIGNNIANSATVGYKSSRAEFADIYAGAKAGLGVKVAAVTQSFGSGSIETTGRDLDLAINGEGFFRFNDGSQTTYSRNGQLTMTSTGLLSNASGAFLTGYAAGQGTGGEPVALQVPTDALAAKATTQAEAVLNLDASTEGLAAADFDSTDDRTYSYSNTMTSYDSQGTSHDVALYFAKDDTADNTWNVFASIDGADVDATTGQQQALTFNNSGVLTTNTPLAFSFDLGTEVNNLDFELDFDGTTQFGSDFNLTTLDQDGYTSGALVGISIEENGTLTASYSNDQTQALGQLALANFRNMQGLESVGDNGWVETTASGQPLLGTAGSGQLGSLIAGATEGSNVDLSAQLVNMIVAQRNYQANAQTIKTQDQILQTLVTLR